MVQSQAREACCALEIAYFRAALDSWGEAAKDLAQKMTVDQKE